MKRIILTNYQTPGDIVVLTAAVRDLHRCYPGQFITDVRTSCPQLWENNVFITPLDETEPDVVTIQCEYPLIHQSNTLPYHFLFGFIEHLNARLSLNIKPTAFKGDIHLSGLENSWISQVEEITGEDTPFWIIVSGGKYDFTTKWWDPRRYQDVVDHFRGRIPPARGQILSEVPPPYFVNEEEVPRAGAIVQRSWQRHPLDQRRDVSLARPVQGGGQRGGQQRSPI